TARRSMGESIVRRPVGVFEGVSNAKRAWASSARINIILPPMKCGATQLYNSESAVIPKKSLVANALVRTNSLGSLMVLGTPVEPEECASNHEKESNHCVRTSSKEIFSPEEDDITDAIEVIRTVRD
ncbi:MAG: hypothetical protein K2J24_02180, partial [Muribaculaceae bacterium]|nr:hypothetical protein [Muribaculaceae bacterium]